MSTTAGSSSSGGMALAAGSHHEHDPILEHNEEHNHSHGHKMQFGHPIGRTIGGVLAYSSDYDTADDTVYPSRSSYMAHHEGIYTGFKYQCVEFARRWLVAVKGITFGDVGMAYEVFSMKAFQRLSDKSVVPVSRHPNGESRVVPVVGAVILWRPGGYFRHTGHIAIVVGVRHNAIEVAEQNVYDQKWPGERHFSRALRMTVAPDGAVTIHDNHRRTEVLGWVHVEEATASPAPPPPRPPVAPGAAQDTVAQ